MKLVLDIGKKYPELTGPFSDAFTAELNQACANGSLQEVVLDMSGTKTISSMAMGAIFAAYQRMREQDRRVHIINASDKVTRLLRMVNMADVLL